jgi:hypothetical protein
MTSPGRVQQAGGTDDSDVDDTPLTALTAREQPIDMPASPSMFFRETQTRRIIQIKGKNNHLLLLELVGLSLLKGQHTNASLKLAQKTEQLL